MTSKFDSDSDDELYIPLSDRLKAKGLIKGTVNGQHGKDKLDSAKNKISPSSPTLLSSGSSSSIEVLSLETAPVSKEVNHLRRSNTLPTLSPTASKCKQRRESDTPDKVSSGSLLRLPSGSSSSSCTSNGLTSLTQPFITEYGKIKKPKVESQKVSSSQSSKGSATSSQPASQGSSTGRAPAQPISSRDCVAVLSSRFQEDNLYPDEDIRKVLSEFQVRFRYSSSSTDEETSEMTVSWMRTFLDEDGNEVETPENQIIIVLPKDRAVKLMCGCWSNSSLGKEAEDVVTLDSSDEDEDQAPKTQDLVTFVENLSKRHPGKNITIIITGMQSYFRNIESKKHNNFKAQIMGDDKKKKSRRKSLGLPVMTEIELSEALIDLEFRTRMTGGATVQTVLCEKSNDVMTQIAAYSKSVAESKNKKQKQEMSSMAWFAANDNKSSVDIQDLVKDVPLLWSKQLQQFPKISRDVAESIVKDYPTVQSLLKKYDSLKSADARKNLLADIPVGRTGKRRVGPETSSRICTFLTSTDPEIFVCREMR